MRSAERRLERLEARVAAMVARAIPPDFDAARHMTFGEILAAEPSIACYGSDVRALEAGDAIMVALFAAAAARAQGVAVAELFAEPADSPYRRLAA